MTKEQALKKVIEAETVGGGLFNSVCFNILTLTGFSFDELGYGPTPNKKVWGTFPEGSYNFHKLTNGRDDVVKALVWKAEALNELNAN